MNKRAFKSIRNVTNVLKEYWSCFRFDGNFDSDDWLESFNELIFFIIEKVKIPDCEFVKKPKWEVRVRKASEMTYGLRNRPKKNGN